MRAVILWTILVVTTGCSSLSSSPMYRDVQLSRGEQDVVVTVFRTEESKLYLLRSAPVYVNNANEVSLPRGSFHAYVLPTGRYRFLSKTFDAASECVLDLEFKQGGDYFIEVIPNSEAVAELLAESLVWMAKVKASGNITSISVGDYNQLCEGMFAFIPTRPEVALQKLPLLRQAN